MPRRSGPSDDEIRRRIREALADEHPDLTLADVLKRAREGGVTLSPELAADARRVEQDRLDDEATDQGRS